MADNLHVTTSDGATTVAADDIAGVLTQRVKIQHGVDGSAVDASASNPLPVTTAAVVASTASPTPVSVGTTVVTLLAANPNRLGVILQNVAGSDVLYVKFGTGAAAPSSFTLIVPNVGSALHWEMSGSLVYTGVITGIRASGAATTNVMVTELTA